MKKILITVILLLNINFLSANGSIQILTDNDRKEVLSIIDRDCADSWCAGDYEYKFQNFSCNDSTAVCTLSFKIIDRDAKPGTVKERNRRCIFKGITSKTKILNGNNLNEEFYDQLNYCVSNRESN